MNTSGTTTPSTARPNGRIWLITGCSSGFGRAIAAAALGHGDTVVATARRPAALDDLVATAPDRALALPLDITDAQAVAATVDAVIARFGRIDVLVNNAGNGAVGAVEETSDAELRALFEVNFFGAAALTRAVLPRMRDRRAGAIVQMSSFGGQVAYPGFISYCATKFALEGFSEALAAEVAPFGIRVLIVEPGAFRTGFSGAALRQSAALPAYAGTVGETRRFITGLDGTQPGDPSKAAAAILAALDADAEGMPLRLALGADAVEGIRTKLAAVQTELGRWQGVSLATAFANTDTGEGALRGEPAATGAGA